MCWKRSSATSRTSTTARCRVSRAWSAVSCRAPRPPNHRKRSNGPGPGSSAFTSFVEQQFRQALRQRQPAAALEAKKHRARVRFKENIAPFLREPKVDTCPEKIEGGGNPPAHRFHIRR